MRQARLQRAILSETAYESPVLLRLLNLCPAILDHQLQDKELTMADYSDLVPADLKPSLSDGTNLKPSITTDSYAGGTPTAAGEVKRSVVYADGTVKPSMTAADGTLKPSVKN